MKVLVVGDVFYDDYIYVTTSRNAAEAPIPVWDEVRRESRPGGAWNVARNIKVMDPNLSVDLVGVLGPSDHGGYENAGFCTGNPLTKTRYVCDGKIIFRHDDGLKYDPVDAELLYEKMVDMKLGGRHYDAVVFSDYDKGTLSPDILGLCQKLSKLIVIDSKRLDLRPFFTRDATTILKLNEGEWSRQVSNGLYPCLEAGFDYVVVTKGADGSQLRQYDSKESRINSFVIHSEDFPVNKVKPIDVTGCGDTHTAAMVVSLLKDNDIRIAVRFANEKATQAVQMFGTTAVC